MKLNKKIFLLFIVFFVLNIFLIDNKIGIGEDDAEYIILARSLINGTGYRNIYSPLKNFHIYHPPLFPIFISILILIFGEKIFIFKIFCLFCFLISVFILLKNFKYFNKNYLYSVFLFLFSPLSFILCREIVSEGLFLVFSFSFLFYFKKYLDKNINFYFFIVLLSAIFSFYTRLIGFALIFGSFIFLFIDKRRKKIFLLLFFSIIFILPWIFWILKNISDSFFYNLLKEDFLIRLIKNATIYFGKVIADAIFYPHFYYITKKDLLFLLKFFIGLLLSLFFIFGFLKNFCKFKIISFYIIFYFLILIIWPYQEPRFLWPIFIFIIFFILEGIDFIFKKNVSKIKNIFFILIILSTLSGDLRIIYKTSNLYSEEEYSFLEALSWIKNNTPKESIIISRKPRATFFHTDRLSISYPNTKDVYKALLFIKDIKANFVILDSIGSKYKDFNLWRSDIFLRPVIESYPMNFHLVFKTKDSKTKIYKFINYEGINY